MKRPLAHTAIYKPEGPAQEYAVWGCNLYKGCVHQCTYCYLRRGPMAKQLGGAVPEIEKKVGGTEEKAYRRFCMEVDAYHELFRADGGIFFSFSTDPMLRETYALTIKCAIYAMEHHVPVYILTKATWWVQNTEIIQQLFPYRYYLHIGFTLTGFDYMEPNAPKNSNRQAAMIMLESMNFKCWASMEPVIDFAMSLAIIETVKDVCREFRIGLLSPYSAKRYDWNECDRFMQHVEKLSNEYEFKVDWKESIKKFYREEKPE